MVKAITMIRVDERLKQELQKLVEAENRTLSNFIIDATNEYIKKQYGKEIKTKTA